MMFLSLWDLNTASPLSLFIRWFLQWPSLNPRPSLTKIHFLLLGGTASLRSGLQLTYDVSILPMPDHSLQILDLGENTCSLKKRFWARKILQTIPRSFQNHTVQLISQLVPAASPPSLPQSPALFIAPCSRPHLNLCLPWVLAKPFVVQGPSLASPNFHALFPFHSSCYMKLPSLL